MSDKKYYTPEESEFHIGFEYESKQYLSYDDKWHKRVVSIDDFDLESDYYNSQKWSDTMPYHHVEKRVQYLSKEDIVSCGWKEKYKDSVGGQSFEIENTDTYYNLSFVFGLRMTVRKRIDGGMTNIFQGTIKNKSELSRLMKQLGIEQTKD